MEKISLDIEFEKAIRLLVEYFPPSQEGSRKPVLAHDVRVGTHLYQNGYSRDIILAGLLHDAIEFSNIDKKIIADEFGENVLELVMANTKDRSIENSDERIDELAKRCADKGRDALIIRAADTIDSFIHYTATDNKGELEYCRKNAEAIFRYLPNDFSDPIFEELRKFL